ncbi:DUF2790 domain-containing protein [Pseudomonas citronellolis]|uniref:DUF2790 domain-containing protein n=1 Tax=Pseudomonas citronellolis TaxID=53408 RepID=UPI0023E39470|nr:DUF2790 domain-containing protein [Pseudomonas citronellolis]MDF3933714.1 DUF2790 domain-containing protein [Pseudomonas citronellolis]
MKTLTLAAALFAFAAPLASFAASAPEPVQQYHYGQHLDVKKVLALHEDPGTCQVVQARMDYLDSAGQPHSLAYQKFSSDCNEGG